MRSITFAVRKPVIVCTIAMPTYDGTMMIGTGVSRMAPDDKWNVDRGKSLAFLRAEKDIVSQYAKIINKRLRVVERRMFGHKKRDPFAPATPDEAKVAKDKALSDPVKSEKMDMSYDAHAEMLRMESTPNIRSTEKTMPEHGQVEVEPND